MSGRTPPAAVPQAQPTPGTGAPDRAATTSSRGSAGGDGAPGTPRAADGTRIAREAGDGVVATVRRGLALSPLMRRGLLGTLLLGVLATLGRVVVPLATGYVVDNGINAEGGPDTSLVVPVAAAGALVVLATAVVSYVVNRRLFTATEAGLAELRTTAFRRVHDLSALTQSSEQRGSLVSRVTTDVDTISTFLQFGGLLLILSIGQVAVVTVIIGVTSWPLLLVVLGCFVPVVLFGRWMQPRVSGAFGEVRARVGRVLGGISETVVGADTIRAYGAEGRSRERVDVAVEDQRLAQLRAQRLVATSFSSAVLGAGVVVAAIVVVGALLGVDGSLTLGELLTVLLLVQLLTGPVQSLTEVLNELQNAVAGWRRVLALLDTPVDLADPGTDGVDLPEEPLDLRVEGLGYSYPGGPPALSDVDLVVPPGTRVAVVGRTGSGKTTLARLVTRLQDPSTGRVLVGGQDLREVRSASLRRRVAMVPQEGFLFEGSVAENVALGREGATRDDVERVVHELGLTAWAADLPDGLDTRVGQRGESLSAGERQLVSLARARVADPDLLVLDEATSAVDPGLDVAIGAALERLMAGRTSVTIAHRLSTAERADLVVVVAGGRVVETGRHADLVAAGGTYAGLHGAWAAQLQPAG
ncbi:ABC transporter ATP-binding protein [Pseudokineococcus sp. 1T1Z-3]|uniref:ABC transporter ATP-binding protein n=1 Tax=Pseudokineococcus sp. 1T1Z-3 TaxID=3132745 RepID=UPI0030A5E8B6